jgi:peptidoglycan/LPS O-acetylase OafA/YrhL/lysophospholipase L1-like esterase
MTVTAQASDAPRVLDDPPVVRRRRRTDPEPLRYEPALDGLRALAVLAVLVYHARFGWAQGGFLGVSTFFTLSGFLITSLLVRERAANGSISLRRFWTRRIKRLVPAAWCTIAAILVVAIAGGWNDDQLRALRGDVPTALAQVINWHFILAGRAYGTSFTAPSPLEHYWSLAVEEQFYVVFPLLVVGALVVFRGRRHLLAGVLAVAAAGSAWWCGHLAAGSVDRAYFGTDTRLAELAIGALLALALVRSLRARGRVGHWLRLAAGLAGLVATVWLWHVATTGSRWLYPWGLLLTAAASCGLIAGALEGGLLGRALSIPPLRWLGVVSYGVYLVHWPIFLILTPQRIGWAPWPLFALRMAVTLAVAAAMYHLLEQPIRRHGLGGRWRPWVVAPMAAAVILVAVAVVTVGLPVPGSLQRASAATHAPPPRPTRVLVVGDQLAASLQPGLQHDAGKRFDVRVAAAPGCGLTVGGFVRIPSGGVERDGDRCLPVRQQWALTVSEFHPDVVVMWGGVRDVADRRLDIHQPWLKPGDPALDAFTTADLGAVSDDLTADGARLVFLTTPHVRNTVDPPPMPPVAQNVDLHRQQILTVEVDEARKEVPPPGFAENDDTRIDHFNALVQQVAASRGATVVDVSSAMAKWKGGELDPSKRPDGVGLTAAASDQIANVVLPKVAKMHRALSAAPLAPAAAAAAPLPVAPPVTPRIRVAPGRTVKVLDVGDSVSYNVGYGLQLWSKSNPGIKVSNAGQFGCPIARGGSYRFLREIEQFAASCDWGTKFPSYVDDAQPDVVVLTSGIWEVVDRILPGDDRWRHIGQDDVDHYELAEVLAAIDALGKQGSTVVLLTYPHFEAGQDQGFAGLPESDPARVDRLNQILRDAAAQRPGVATVVDLQGWLAQQPGGELDPAKRDDGLHFRDAYVPTIGAWLGPQLENIARTGQP